jgi:hypothetical protein
MPSVAKQVPFKPLGPTSSLAYLDRPSREVHLKTEETLERAEPFVKTLHGVGLAKRAGNFISAVSPQVAKRRQSINCTEPKFNEELSKLLKNFIIKVTNLGI